MCMYVYVCVCMSVYVCVCMCMYAYVYVCVCMCMYVHVCVCMCMYVYECAQGKCMEREARERPHSGVKEHASMRRERAGSVQKRLGSVHGCGATVSVACVSL